MNLKKSLKPEIICLPDNVKPCILQTLDVKLFTNIKIINFFKLDIKKQIFLDSTNSYDSLQPLLKRQKIEDEYYHIDVPKEIETNYLFKTFIFKFKRHINSGSFGHVLEYNCMIDNILYSVALKVGDLKEDLLALNKLKELDNLKFKLKKNELASYDFFIDIVTCVNEMDKNISYLLMSIISGNMVEFIEQKYLNYNNFWSIFREIIKGLLFFYENGLIFTDIKLENIFFKLLDDGKFRLYFGDVAGITSIGESGIFSIIPPNYTIIDNKYKFDFIASEKNLMWCIGVVLLLFVNLDYDIIQPKKSYVFHKYNFFINNLKNSTESIILKFKKKTIGFANQDKLILILENTFVVNENNRWNLNKLYEII